MRFISRRKPKTFREPVAAFTHRVGTRTAVKAESPRGRWAVVFEDDRETGYLYGLDEWQKPMPILDALQIYTVAGVADPDADYPIEIRWADGRNRVGLFIEGRCHAVFDFDEKRAACRDGFPPADSGFTASHEWDEALAEGL